MKKDYTHNYIGVLLEDLNSKFDRMAEVLAGVVETQQIHTDKFNKIEAESAVFRSLHLAHDKELGDHENRIKVLETKTSS